MPQPVRDAGQGGAERRRMKAEYPCPDSNRGARFRKPLLYPPELQGHPFTLYYMLPAAKYRASAFGVPMLRGRFSWVVAVPVKRRR